MLGWLALAIFAGAALRAEEMRASKPEVRKEVVAVIDAQLAAFRAGDPAKAWSYASVELQASRPLSVFTKMVRENYAEIWANARAEYGLVRDDGMRATVSVRVYAKKENAEYDFTLVKERAGWRIAAVLRHAPNPEAKI